MVERNGKYYFYYTAEAKIGVAVGDSPTGPFYISVAAGDNNKFLDQLQCELTFNPSEFLVQAFVANRTVQVEGLRDIVDDPDPRGMLRQWALQDLASLPYIQSNLYISQVGGAFLANANSKLDNPNINASIPYQEQLLPAFEESFEALMDDILQSLGAYALTQSSKNWVDDRETVYYISTIRIGSDRFSYPLLILNFVALLAICALSIYTSMFATSPAFDFTDLGAMMAAGWNAKNASSSATSQLEPQSWDGDPADPVLSGSTLVFNTGLEPTTAISVAFESARYRTILG